MTITKEDIKKGIVKKIIIDRVKDFVYLSEMTGYEATFAKENGKLIGMVVKEKNKGWILKIGNTLGSYGHCDTFEECIRVGVHKRGYEFVSASSEHPDVMAVVLLGDPAEEDDHVGVHRTHCCLLHGCKYSDPSCPVENGEVCQDHICETCEHEHIKSVDAIISMIHLGIRKCHECGSLYVTE
jgi:hypothetical protein